MYPLNLTVDLLTQRFVYQNDIGIGVRQIDLVKGNTYSVNLSFISGASGVSGFVPSGLNWNISFPNAQTTPLVYASGLSGNSFSLFVASPVMDYALCNQTQAYLSSYVNFSGNGVSYELGALSTFLDNNAFLSPAAEYYPLNANPSGYATGALPSIQSFTYSIPTGINKAFVSYPSAFTGIPTVAYNLDIPVSGNFYGVATSGINTSGFGVYFSSTITGSGYALSVIAKQ